MPKNKITSIILIVVTVFLLGAIIYISSLVTSGGKEESNIAPRKTKAASITYSKLIALNTTVEVSPTISPTEKLLTYQSTSTTQPTTTVSPTGISPTKIKDLPNAGFVYNGLIIFTTASLLIFFSFLF